MNRLLFLLTGLFIFSAFGFQKAFFDQLGNQGDQNHLRVAQAQDSPNVLVQADCCPCRSGGQLMSVHEDQVLSHQENLRNNCSGDVVCPMSYNCYNWRVLCQTFRCSEAVSSQFSHLPEE